MWLSKQEYGQVPQYLLKRKLATAAAYAQELVRQEDAACMQHMGWGEVIWSMASMLRGGDGIGHQHRVWGGRRLRRRLHSYPMACASCQRRSGLTCSQCWQRAGRKQRRSCWHACPSLRYQCAISHAGHCETLRCLQGLPFVTKTERHRKLKAELEDRLQEIAEAEDMFSQPKMLVEL